MQKQAQNGGVPAPPPAPPAEVPRPLRYDVADRFNAAIKKLPLIHPLIRKSLVPRKP